MTPNEAMEWAGVVFVYTIIAAVAGVLTCVIRGLWGE